VFGKERTLFRLFGLPIKADLSWLFLVALVIVSLAQNYFPKELGHVTPRRLDWVLAAIGAAGLFMSLIIHEVCHSLVARATGMPVAGITLFIFGGVSQLEDEPPTAGAEFLMAIVGPLASVVIGVVLLVMWLVGMAAHWPVPALAVMKSLWIINFLLAAFNSMPAFPLDGGRVLRSVVWAITRSLRVATHVAANIGSAFGILMIILGVGNIMMMKGSILSGVWLMVIGFFVRQAALGSLQMVILRQSLEGDKIKRFMTSDLVTVPCDMSLQQFVEDYVFHHRFSYYPVVDEAGDLVGLLSARAPREVASQLWLQTPVARVMKAADQSLILDPEADAMDALSALRQREEHRAVIVQGRKPVGIVSLRDLLNFLALKIDLEPRRRYS
jgi:Zn-dependent protease/CBS domain-containing protein